MKCFRVFITFIVALFYITTLPAIELSNPRAYKSSEHSGKNISLEFFTVGEKKDKLILAFINAPAFEEDGKYAVYKGNCETTTCKKVFYKEYAGTAKNIVSESGYYGEYVSLLLFGEKKAIYLQYDKSASKKLVKEVFLQKYLSSVGRMQSGIPTDKELNISESSAIDVFFNYCGSTLEFTYSKNDFIQKSLGYLLGMGRFYVEEIAKACTDEMYKNELSKIKKIMLIPSENKKTIRLKSPDMLEIFLSDDSYNPSGESRLWLESL